MLVVEERTEAWCPPVSLPSPSFSPPFFSREGSLTPSAFPPLPPIHPVFTDSLCPRHPAGQLGSRKSLLSRGS